MGSLGDQFGKSFKESNMARPSVPGRLFTAWILAWLAMTADAAAPLPEARDLAADATIMRTQHLPLMVLFSRNNCSWCEKVRREYLASIAAEPSARILLRQVDIDRDTALTDFDGRTTSHRAFAQAHQAKLAPTLMFFGPDGELIADTLVGYHSTDFYGALIDRAIENGRERLRSQEQ
jgi:thioredoxin-related protein